MGRHFLKYVLLTEDVDLNININTSREKPYNATI